MSHELWLFYIESFNPGNQMVAFSLDIFTIWWDFERKRSSNFQNQQKWKSSKARVTKTEQKRRLDLNISRSQRSSWSIVQMKNSCWNLSPNCFYQTVRKLSSKPVLLISRPTSFIFVIRFSWNPFTFSPYCMVHTVWDQVPFELEALILITY